MANQTTVKPKPAKYKKYMLVRYGMMNLLGLFEHNESQILKLPCRVVVKTSRGLELGELVGQLGPYKGGQFRLSPNQISRYYQTSEIDTDSAKPAGTFLRYATAEDIGEERHLRKSAEEELQCCKKLTKQLQLPMKIVTAEHIFGGERIIFYFTADGRIDFRELVKKLAQEYQTRIEMRQIGPRDEAKILGDLESCGQQCCCIRFLQFLKPVNMRMAKLQKATLDPSKISGYCGRLKCCLRYEDQTYCALKKNLPKKNTRVNTKQGQGTVLDTQILTQLVMVELADGTKIAVNVDELEVISPTRPQKQNQQNDEQPDEKNNNNNNEQ